MGYRCWVIGVVALLMTACSEYQVSDDPTLRLSFSADTVCFDTVFTEQGSSTAQLIVYNPNKNALVIERVWFEQGQAFRVNVDGEADLNRMTNLTVYGGDSLIVFLRVTDFGKAGTNEAVLTEDKLHFQLTNGKEQHVVLEAFAQDAKRIKGQPYANYHFTAAQPYILFDTVIIEGALTLDAGARLYMHKGACIVALGDVSANGTYEQPVVIKGDRLDRLFDSVPYAYAGGSWNGIYLQTETPKQYKFDYVDILSGNIGLSCYSECTGTLPQLTMNGCRIHNHTKYGLVLTNTDAKVVNTEISNCASYCVYCQGGTHDFIHTTVASYFGSTDINIQAVTKENVAAVYIDDLSKTTPKTITSFYNSIITGHRDVQLVLATPLEQYYAGKFVGNYIGKDTAKVFVNDFYKYKEYVYYDFRLDSLSPARGIGDSIVALPYPMDRNKISRAGVKPDAGCYQYQP